MVNQFRLYLLLGLFLFLTNSCKKEQLQKVISANLEILVVDKNDRPIEAAEIVLIDKSLTKKTNSSGEAQFDQVAVGEVIAIVKKKYYLDQSIKIIVKKDHENFIKVQMKDGDSYLNLDPKELILGPKGEISKIKISSNASWYVETNANWIDFDINNGNGDAYLNAEILPNTSDSSRESTIDFKISDSTIRLKVIQKIELKLMSHTDGNTPLSDSIYLTFNKPIKINKITSLTNLCIPSDLGHQLSNENRTVKFKFPCAALGDSFPIHFSVSDYDGQTLSETVQIDYFSKKLELESFHRFLMDPDNKHFWVITRNSYGYEPTSKENKLIKINLESFNVVQDFTLPSQPSDIAFNPYNHLIYITTDQKPEIYVFDSKKGKIVKTITLKTLRGDLEMYPFIYPQEILFTNSGFGIVNVGNNQMSGSVWKAIDATKKDSIYYFPEVENQLYKSIKSPILINAEKDIVGYLDGELPIIINGTTKKYNKFFESPVPFTFNPYFFSNPNGTKLLIMGYWEQALVQLPNRNIINRSYNGVIPWAFSNEEGEENHIFALTGERSNYLSLLNYSKTKTELFFPSKIIYNYKNLTVSKDNKYFIAAHHQFLYRFDNVMFSSRFNYDVVSPISKMEMQLKSRTFR